MIAARLLCYIFSNLRRQNIFELLCSSVITHDTNLWLCISNSFYGVPGARASAPLGSLPARKSHTFCKAEGIRSVVEGLGLRCHGYARSASHSRMRPLTGAAGDKRWRAEQG